MHNRKGEPGRSMRLGWARGEVVGLVNESMDEVGHTDIVFLSR